MTAHVFYFLENSNFPTPRANRFFDRVRRVQMVDRAWTFYLYNSVLKFYAWSFFHTPKKSHQTILCSQISLRYRSAFLFWNEFEIWRDSPNTHSIDQNNLNNWLKRSTLFKHFSEFASQTCEFSEIPSISSAKSYPDQQIFPSVNLQLNELSSLAKNTNCNWMSHNSRHHFSWVFLELCRWSANFLETYHVSYILRICLIIFVVYHLVKPLKPLST